MDLDANAGIDPSDEGYLDLTEGGIYFDLTQPPALEAERLWDFLSTEVVAAMFVQSAWGEYLDLHGEMIGVERKDEVKATGEVRFTADADGITIFAGTQVAQPVPITTPDADPVTFATTETVVTLAGEAVAPIEALEAGPEGNVGASQIDAILTPIDGVTEVVNDLATSGGTDVESDEAYQERLLLEWQSPGAAGNVADYEKWALAYPGVGYVTVEAATPAPYNVTVIVADAERNPSSGAVTLGLKALLDPGDGTGEGLAPIGATVIVSTITSVTVPIAAEVTGEPGYTVDGAGGTIALRDAIETTITDYINSLDPGENVVLSKVESLFFRVAGVYDVTDVTLNGVAANFVISPTQVAVASPPMTLTDGVYGGP